MIVVIGMDRRQHRPGCLNSWTMSFKTRGRSQAHSPTHETHTHTGWLYYNILAPPRRRACLPYAWSPLSFPSLLLLPIWVSGPTCCRNCLRTFTHLHCLSILHASHSMLSNFLPCFSIITPCTSHRHLSLASGFLNTLLHTFFLPKDWIMLCISHACLHSLLQRPFTWEALLACRSPVPTPTTAPPLSRRKEELIGRG